MEQGVICASIWGDTTRVGRRGRADGQTFVTILRQYSKGEYSYSEDVHLQFREVARTQKCVVCGEEFITRSNLRQHMGSHNRIGGEKMNTGTDKLGLEDGLHGRASHPVAGGLVYPDRQLGLGLGKQSVIGWFGVGGAL